MKKMLGDIIILHVYQKSWSHDVQFLRYGAQRTDRPTEKVTLGAQPKKTMQSKNCDQWQ